MKTLFVFLDVQLWISLRIGNLQFAAWDWITQKKKKIKIALSLGYPNSYFYNKRCNMLLQWLHLSFFGLYNVAALT